MIEDSGHELVPIEDAMNVQLVGEILGPRLGEGKGSGLHSPHTMALEFSLSASIPLALL